MTEDCQAGRKAGHSLAIAVAGVAGSGKTTLGTALASCLGLALLDLDALTNPVLDALPVGALGGHWLASPHLPAIRAGRYAALRAVAHDVVQTSGGVVLVAPFTRELRGGADWRALCLAVAPAALTVVHLIGPPDLFAARREARAADRDRHRPPDQTPVPAIPTIAVRADLELAQQLSRVRLALRASGADSGRD